MNKVSLHEQCLEEGKSQKILQESHVFQNYEKICLELGEVFRKASSHKIETIMLDIVHVEFFQTH